MESILQFNIQRLGYLLLRDIKRNWKAYASFLGGFLAIVLMTSLVWAYDMDNDAASIHLNFFPFGLLAGGFLFTSVIFREFANPIERSFYLSLPASNLEKLLSKLIISNFLFIIIGVGVYFLFSVLNNSLVEMLTEIDVNPFNPFSESNLEVISIYFVLHSIFFLGALAFPRFSLPKTILTVFIIAFLIATILGIAFRITFAEFFDTVFVLDDFDVAKPHPGAQKKVESFGYFITWVFKYLTAPVLWIVAYFKLIEKEV